MASAAERQPDLPVIGAAALFVLCAAAFTDLRLLSMAVPVPVPSMLAFRFEHHAWMFAAGFLGILFVSRGHLWSFGINSKNLPASMRWTAGAYAAAVSVAAFAVMTDAPLRAGWEGTADSGAAVLLSMLILWMSSPVASQILFFGFFQTMLAKSIGYERRLGPVPAAVAIPVLLFAILPAEAPFALPGGDTALALLIGSYSATAYWKTGSLIAPMLGHAVLLGLPFALSLAVRYV